MSAEGRPGGRDPIEAVLEARAGEGVFAGAAWRIEAAGAVLSRGAAGRIGPPPSGASAGTQVPYDLASLTKPLATAVLALLLEREGRLDLEAGAASLLPELRGSPYEDVTLRDLGCHRAGLPDWRPLYLRARDLSGYAHAIAALPPAAPRGTSLYSDLGYILLGAAVERAAGEALDRSFEKRIANPLGLDSIGFPREGRAFSNAAPTEAGTSQERELAGDEGRSYAWRDRAIPGVVHDENARVLGGVAGHAGLFGTVDAVATIGREILSPRILALGPRQRALLLEPEGDSGGRSFGLMTAGESTTLRAVLPQTVVGHFGFTGTSVWIDPSRSRVYVLLTNRTCPRSSDPGIVAARREFHRIAAGLGSP